MSLDRHDAILQHMTRHFGEPSSVLHELASQGVHVDVHLIRPRPERPWWTLFTTGLSERPMNVPAGAEEVRFAELVLALPENWPVEAIIRGEPEAARFSWPIDWLKFLARFPHMHQTWFGVCHTLPNGDPPDTFAPDTRLCAWLFLPPITVPPEGRSVALEHGDEVHLLALHGLLEDELQLKVTLGVNALLDLFAAADVKEVLDLDRPSTLQTA